MRGVYVFGSLIFILILRFIPTCVGFTSERIVSTTFPAGSSPRTWGLRSPLVSCALAKPVHPHARGVYAQVSHPVHGEDRFIPTHVGFTVSATHWIKARYGSSPRTWGLRAPLTFTTSDTRFIPTHVGFTLKHGKKNVEIPSDFLPISSKKFQTEFLALVVIDGATAFLTRMIFPAPRHSEPPVGTVPHR